MNPLPNCVETIEDLRALPAPAGDEPTQQGARSCVTVLGYHRARDGGGGVFWFDRLAGAADDGGTVIAPAEPPNAVGRWRRLLNEGVGLNVKWFGARGDGSGDDAPAIQRAFDLARGVVLLPPGTYPLGSTLVLERKAGISVQGAGCGNVPEFETGTRLIWRGTPDQPMLKLLGSRDVLVSRVRMEPDPPYQLSCAIACETHSPGFAMTRNVFRDLFISGTDRGLLGKGVCFRVGPYGEDQNNGESLFENVVVSHYTNAGWSFEHAQSAAHLFLKCHISSNAASEESAGVRAVGGIYINWIGGTASRNTEADFVLDGSTSGLSTIKGILSEGSSCFLKTLSRRTTQGVIVEGGSFNTSGLGDAGVEKIIDFQLRGPLMLIGWHVIGAARKQAAISFDSGAEPHHFLVVGGSFATSLENPFVGQEPTFQTAVSIANSTFPATTFDRPDGIVLSDSESTPDAPPEGVALFAEGDRLKAINSAGEVTELA